MGSRGVALGNSQTPEGHPLAASLKGLLGVEQSTESRPLWRSRGPYLLSLWPCLEWAREVELGCSTPFFGCAWCKTVPTRFLSSGRTVGCGAR